VSCALTWFCERMSSSVETHCILRSLHHPKALNMAHTTDQSPTGILWMRWGIIIIIIIIILLYFLASLFCLREWLVTETRYLLLIKKKKERRISDYHFFFNSNDVLVTLVATCIGPAFAVCRIAHAEIRPIWRASLEGIFVCPCSPRTQHVLSFCSNIANVLCCCCQRKK